MMVRFGFNSKWWIMLVALAHLACGEGSAETKKTVNPEAVAGKAATPEPEETGKVREAAQVTFVELGSVNCIPCKQMVPVMAAIEEKYGNLVNIVFYDVWQAEQKHYAQEYGIRVIPTQVFMDAKGKEFFRHEGFFPQVEIEKLLAEAGVEPVVKNGE